MRVRPCCRAIDRKRCKSLARSKQVVSYLAAIASILGCAFCRERNGVICGAGIGQALCQSIARRLHHTARCGLFALKNAHRMITQSGPIGGLHLFKRSPWILEGDGLGRGSGTYARSVLGPDLQGMRGHRIQSRQGEGIGRRTCALPRSSVQSILNIGNRRAAIIGNLKSNAHLA